MELLRTTVPCKSKFRGLLKIRKRIALPNLFGGNSARGLLKNHLLTRLPRLYQFLLGMCALAGVSIPAGVPITARQN